MGGNSGGVDAGIVRVPGIVTDVISQYLGIRDTAREVSRTVWYLCVYITEI